MNDKNTQESKIMGKVLLIPIALGRIIVIIFGAIFIWFGRFDPKKIETLHNSGDSKKKVGKDQTLTVMTWNLGYAGLGKESSFFYGALGKGRLLPPSRGIVKKNIAGEVTELIKSNADILFLQEVTTQSVMNFNVRMWEQIKGSMSGYNAVFSPSLKLEIPFKMIHGNAILSKYESVDSRRFALPLESNGMSSKLKHRFNFVLERLPIDGSEKEWVLIDLHFAAFDRDGETRKKQLECVMEVMIDNYRKGNFVVVGGDWNLQLASTEFSAGCVTPSWVERFPPETRKELTDAGWRMAADPSVPSVRANDRPYDGTNYMTIIDGFLCSPNIEMICVQGMDLGFDFSDHNPVKLVLKARDANSLTPPT